MPLTSPRETMSLSSLLPRTHRPGQITHAFSSASFTSCISFTSLLLSVFFLASCGAPGEPTPPSPPIPTPVSDLAARQSGDAVQLTFTVPAKTVTGDRLAEPPAVEILRGNLRPDGSPDNKSFRAVYTIPGALLDSYLKENRLEFSDPIPPAEIRARSGAPFAYRVRTRASKKRASAESNTVTVQLYPVAAPIASVQARLTEPAIELTWPAPTGTSAGDPLSQVSGYRIYRGELDPSSPLRPPADLAQANWKTPLTLLAPSPTNNYRDTLFDFGKTYAYVVRSVTVTAGGPLESSDSPAAIVPAQDTFPPAAPQGIAAAVLPGSQPGSLVVDLSWSINLETDLAGYRIYRSEQEGPRGALLTQELLLTPAYRDTSVQPGHRYWYSVTAIDRAGNESDASASRLVEAVQPPP